MVCAFRKKTARSAGGAQSRDGKPDWIHITGLRRGEGFLEGERVWVLGPRTGNAERPIAESSILARATIDAVRSGRVRARLDDRTLHSKNFREVCGGRYGPSGAWSGCEVILESDGGELGGNHRIPLSNRCVLLPVIGFHLPLWRCLVRTWGGVVCCDLHGSGSRHFFHAHLTTFDVPVTAMIFWLVVGFWFSVRSRKWAGVAGVLFGLALLTKLNAFFVPVVLGLWWLTLAGNSRLEGGGFPMGSWKLRPSLGHSGG